MAQQAIDADVDIEFQLNSKMAAESASLAVALLNANRKFATMRPSCPDGARGQLVYRRRVALCR